MLLALLRIFTIFAVVLCSHGYHISSVTGLVQSNTHRRFQGIKSACIQSYNPDTKVLRFHRRVSAKYAKKGPTDKVSEVAEGEEKEQSAFEQVASKGLAGVLAIALAESIFWALGVPFAALWVKYTTGEWIDLTTQEGQLQAAGFSFGYGGFATVILQYRVTLFAIPLVPLMEKYVVEPGKKIFGEQFGEKSSSSSN